MTVTVYRFGKAKHANTLFSGIGGLYAAGRWTPRGQRVVYTSENASLAQLEYIVNYKNRGWVPSTVMAKAEIPDTVRIESVEMSTLPARWEKTPPPSSLRRIGRNWLKRAATACLRVPSAITPGEWNYLLNPAHDDFALIEFAKPSIFVLDARAVRARKQ